MDEIYARHFETPKTIPGIVKYFQSRRRAGSDIPLAEIKSDASLSEQISKARTDDRPFADTAKRRRPFYYSKYPRVAFASRKILSRQSNFSSLSLSLSRPARFSTRETTCMHARHARPTHGEFDFLPFPATARFEIVYVKRSGESCDDRIIDGTLHSAAWL